MFGDLRRRFRNEPAAFVRYLLSGGITVAFYTFLLVLLVEAFEMSPGLSAGIAMVFGGALNYLLNKLMVFRSRRQHVEAAPRYVAVLLANAGANAAVTWLACDLGGLPYGPVQVIYLTVATITVFILMRQWVMSHREPTRDNS